MDQPGFFDVYERLARLSDLASTPKKIGSSIPPAWRRRYNTVRPHSSLGYRPPAPKKGYAAIAALGSASPYLQPTPAPEATMH